MQKEIFEQPESVVNTMRGRVNFENNTGEPSCAQISESLPDQTWVMFLGNLQFLRNNYMDLTGMNSKHLPDDANVFFFFFTLAEKYIIGH